MALGTEAAEISGTLGVTSVRIAFDFRVYPAAVVAVLLLT